MDEYRPVQLLVEEHAADGLQALVALSTMVAPKKLTVTNLQPGPALLPVSFCRQRGACPRSLRPLLTPDSRAAALPILLQQGRRLLLKEVERDIARINHEQWVSWHWQKDNPMIHSDIRMLPPLPLSCLAVPASCALRYGFCI